MIPLPQTLKELLANKYKIIRKGDHYQMRYEVIHCVDQFTQFNVLSTTMGTDLFCHMLKNRAIV